MNNDDPVNSFLLCSHFLIKLVAIHSLLVCAEYQTCHYKMLSVFAALNDQAISHLITCYIPVEDNFIIPDAAIEIRYRCRFGENGID